MAEHRAQFSSATAVARNGTLVCDFVGSAPMKKTTGGKAHHIEVLAGSGNQLGEVCEADAVGQQCRASVDCDPPAALA